ncbi:MAG: hypothetical protein M1827_003650 [Pycnora praestabilis]|nr:MAG: hypothetical protein M1827_003650 [Pycnora praestabilis]
MPNQHNKLVHKWHAALCQVHHEGNDCDTPSYWANDPLSLVTESTIESFSIGSGVSVLSTIHPAIEAAEHEVLIVTCFWAASPSLNSLATTLKRLSKRHALRKQRIRIRINLSSLSLFQKLFHTSSLSGHIYPPETWATEFGLPPLEELQGLDLQIKSIFVRPFSVMHPKFIVIDRKYVWVPSCNFSWETWFEGAVKLKGPIVSSYVEFWKKFWGRDDLPALDVNDTASRHAMAPSELITTDYAQDSSSTDLSTSNALFTTPPITTIFLPSPHHSSPNFHAIPWQSPAPPPPTPLNLFLLHLFSTASSQIYIQTPNLTSPPVLSAILSALERGVDVSILTNRRMMMLEQLLTAGTLTEICVYHLRRRYRHLVDRKADVHDVEAAKRLGKLTIRYYRPRRQRGEEIKGGEPVKSHLKLTVVDKETMVLGSGNMDRASWYTSQEVGVAFISKEAATSIMGAVQGSLEGKTEIYPV